MKTEWIGNTLLVTIINYQPSPVCS